MKNLNLEDPNNIIATVRRTANGTEFTYEDTSVERGKKYVYAITAVDRLHNESEAKFANVPLK